MEATNNHNPINVLSNKRKDKDTYFRNQTAIVYGFLQTNTATASMITEATKIPQKNITRYKRTLEKKGLLRELYKGLCKVTNFRASYLTTNKDLI